MSRAKKERKVAKKKRKGQLTMEQIANLPSIQEMWEPWDSLANELIPEGFTVEDAEKGSIRPDLVNEGWVRDRLEYLSDRADPARVYWLDFAIRVLLGKRPRDRERNSSGTGEGCDVTVINDEEWFNSKVD